MKKMRRLIPAIAMLLVSAVMLSTATFAWFTTNEAVTASGMQVQAKATGSLVISTSPLTFASTNTSADLQTAVTQLRPSHLVVNADAGEWQFPGKPSSVNPITGKIDTTDALAPQDISANTAEFYFDNVVYVGSAGDALTAQTLSIDLSAPVVAAGTETVTKAYAVAIYVCGTVTGEADTVATPAWNAKPAAIAYVDTYDNRNVDTLDVTVDIPSIVGVGDQNSNLTGLKLVIRVFVDGDLESDANTTTLVPTGTYTYAKPANKTFSATAQYFVQSGSDYIPAVIPEEYYDGSATTIPDTWYTRTADTASQTYKYVNSKNVPTAASSLQVEFSLE